MRSGWLGGGHGGQRSWRHHQPSAGVNGRDVQQGALVEIGEGGGLDAGYVKPEGGDYKNNSGDLQSMVRWKPSSREHAAFSPAFSALLASAPSSSGPQPRAGQSIPPGGNPGPNQNASGGGGLLPLFGPEGDADDRFESIAPKYGSSQPGFIGFPAGISGHVSAGMDEFSLRPIFHPDWTNALIAPNRAGNPNYGTQVFDLTANNELDPNRWARLQDFWTVMDYTPGAPACGLSGKGLAWAIGRGGNLEGGPGRGVMVDHDRGEYHMIGTQGGGPIIGGVACQHGGQLGTDADGRAGFPAHITTDAFFLGNTGDGPLLFEAEPWKEPDGDEGLWRFCHLRWRPFFPHQNGCVKGRGYWAIEVRTPTKIVPPPWIPDPEPPPFRPPPDEIIGTPVGGFGPFVGTPRTPTGAGQSGEGDDEEISLGPQVPPEKIPDADQPAGAGPGSGSIFGELGYNGPGTGVSTGAWLDVPSDLEVAPPQPDGGLGEENADGSALPEQEPGTTESDEDAPEGGGSLGELDEEFEAIPGEDEERAGGDEEQAEDTRPGPGTTTGAPPTNSEAGGLTPLYEYGTQCSFLPGMGWLGVPSDYQEVMIGGGRAEQSEGLIGILPVLGGTVGLPTGGNGTIAGTPVCDLPNGLRVADGMAISLPASVFAPDVVAGLYDPCREGRAPKNTITHAHPGGLSSITFSHPKVGTETGFSGGGLVEQSADGSGIRLIPINKAGEKLNGEGVHVEEGGTTVLGDLTVTGSINGGTGGSEIDCCLVLGAALYGGYTNA